MNSFNLNDDKERATVSRVEPENTSINEKGISLLQRLTTVFFIGICIMILILAMRIINHVKIMSENKIPENAVYNSDQKPKPEEETEYVDEVTYNPSKLGNELADAQNKYSSDSSVDLHGEGLWFVSSTPSTWTFKSGYDYKSSKIDCIWICTSDETGDVYAYHMATYDGANNEFKDGVTHITKKGGDERAAD